MKIISTIGFAVSSLVILVNSFSNAQAQQPLTIAQELFMHNRHDVTHEIKSDAQGRVIWDENYATTYNYKDDSFDVPSGNGDNKGWDFVTSQQPQADKGVLAFSMYQISVTGTNDYVYMDYRDKDYIRPDGAVEGDVRLYYYGNGRWEVCQGDGQNRQDIANHGTIGIWNIFNRTEPNRSVFHVHVTITNNFTGGKISWNGTFYSAPYSAEVVLLSHNTFAAITPQTVNGKVYGFRKWADGVTSISRPLDDDGYHYQYPNFIANFWNAYLSGPSYLNENQVGTFTAYPSGGTTPYNYTWYKMQLCGGVEPLGPPCDVWVQLPQFNGSQRATASGLAPGFKMRVDVTDAQGYLISVEKEVTVGGSLPKSLAPEEPDKEAPGRFTLFPNHPNPFNLETTIRYQLAEESRVSLSVYNLLGEEVKGLVAENQPAGTYTIQWDSKDRYGREVSSGIYICRGLIG
ncbi:MAG: hypothetical protein ONB05_11315 [candidate division KSB1 bacterium]|nr:hypothetical protein [candidate division KSB1 bacterium]